MSRNNVSKFLMPVFTARTIAAADSLTTTDIFELGKTENQALDWDVESVSPVSMQIEILQSNAQLGPFTKWSATSAAGSAVVNDITTAVEQDGSDIQLVPSGYCKVKVTNLGADDLVINRMTFLLQ